MEGKKISFSFMKTKKAEKPATDNNDDKKDFIECVEEQSIKVIGGEDVVTNEPLVIPMKPNSLMKADRFKEIALEVESALAEPVIKTEPIGDVNMSDPLAEPKTLEQMAVRELMQEVKKGVVIDNPSISIPSSTKGVAEGEKESTLEDYEAVPVQEFGVAMLRGMGWTPGQASSTYKQPELRPKGLGLGADKAKKVKSQQTKDGKQEEMEILKNSFVKIIQGKYADYYGKVVSLDEDNGRVVVDIPLKKATVSLSEFMMHAVTKSEYDRESKVINAESYEEYKRNEISKKSSKQYEYNSPGQRESNKEKDRKRENESEKREEKEKDRRYEKERRDERERRQDREKERKEERENQGKDNKERDRMHETENQGKDKREKERRHHRENQGMDKREREREKERMLERETERKDEKGKERRDEREQERRNERDKARKDREEDTDSDDPRRQRDRESANGRSKNRQKNKESSSSEERSIQIKKNRKRDSSSDSSSSLSEYDKKQNKHSKNKSRKRSTTPEAKRDIDKKRKGKKKKRDRDRSPNYKKHRK